MPFARFALIVNLLVPLALLSFDALGHNLGADPVNFAIHTTGIIAVIYLLLSLAVTPLRTITGWTWLIQFRRSLGVYAFYYACVHLTIYFWWDRQRSLSSTFHEISHRYYLLIGFSSLCLMAPLWATSFNAAIRGLGGRNWKRLHRLAYVAAALACWHFYLQSKADKRRPDWFFAVLGALLLWRVSALLSGRSRAGAKVAATGAIGSAAMGAGIGGVPGKARFWKGDLKVVEMKRETPTVRTFRLATPDGQRIPFDFKAGQFLNLTVEIDGQRTGRSYSIASPPTRDEYLELTIKREDNGKVSQFLHDKLMTGQSVAVSGPAGRFSFDANKFKPPVDGILLVAGGVGITPVMSILRDLVDRNWPGKIDLLFSVRSQEDVVFADELHGMQVRHKNVHVHITITRETPDEWQGYRGRISAELLKKCIPDLAARPACLCGPDAMAVAAKEQLIAAGVRADWISVESFTPAAAVAKDNGAALIDELAAAESADVAIATVTFSRSNRRAPLPPGRSILEAAEGAGVEIDYQCRAGICGTCRCKLLSGVVTMDVRDALSDADESDGYILACQAHANADVVIDA